jgi:type IV secretory pathway VirB4 component
LKEIGKTFDADAVPTLEDLYKDISLQESYEAQQLAIGLERFVNGSSDIFAKKTNIDMKSRFVVFDVSRIEGLKSVGLHICFDHIWNRMIENYKQHKLTRIYIDEFHNLMTSESSAAYIAQIWKRARKWGGIPTAITQNIEDMLKSENARSVINNSSCIMLLAQTDVNRIELSNIYSISSAEQEYISTSKPGMGLIRIHNKDIIPMNDDFPKDTELYRIMSTKPDERL